MPANFPTADQIRHYGRYAEEPTIEQLGQYFHLTDTDRRLIYSRTEQHTQLGLAVQIGTVRFLGKFLVAKQWASVPDNVVRYVGAQLNLEPAHWREYYSGRRPTIGEHQALIRKHYDYRDFNDPAEQFATIR